MSDWYCPLPFRHAYIDSTGIAACCQTQRYQVALDEWATHPELIKLQQELLAGNKPAVCKSCVRQEQIYGASLRTNSNRDYNNQVFTDTNLDFIDFRSVNINLKSLKRIMFTGGEPTLIPGVRNLINKIKLHHKEIMVMITSNASFQDDFWFEITEQLPNLHWTVSVDAVGPAAEIVRHGSDWAVIERNVSWLAQHAQSLDINSVVSNLTIFELKPLLEFGRNMQQLSITPIGRHGDRGCRHQFFVCQRPYWLAADNLSEELLHQAVPYLESCTTLDLDDEQRNMLDGLVSQIKSAKFDPQLWNKSQSYNQTLNQIRNEDHLTLYDTQKYKYLHAP